MLRFGAGSGDDAGPVTALRAGEALPEMVCRRVMGEGVRAILPPWKDDPLDADPMTSFRDILGPLEATCHGDAGCWLCVCSVSAALNAGTCLGESACCCCCFLRSRWDSLAGSPVDEASPSLPRKDNAVDIFETLFEESCAMMSFISSFDVGNVGGPQGFLLFRGIGEPVVIAMLA